MTITPIISPDVKTVFQTYSPEGRTAMMSLRALIFEVASANSAVGILTETLKWGVPSYLTEKSKSGSTIRISWSAAKPKQAALYFNCKTTLVDRMRDVYPDTFTFQSNRVAAYSIDARMPREALMHCIEMALLYHRNKRKIA